MRGQGFHNELVRRSAAEFEAAGLDVSPEHGLRMPDGRWNFVDLLVTSGSQWLACEIETTTRYVAVNAEKAMALGLPLWIVTPTRRLRTAARKIVNQAPDSIHSRGASVVTPGVTSGGGGIRFLLPDEVSQALRDGFPDFSASESPGNTLEKQKHE